MLVGNLGIQPERVIVDDRDDPALGARVASTDSLDLLGIALPDYPHSGIVKERRIGLGTARDPPVDADVADSPAKARQCRSKQGPVHGLRIERGGAERKPRENIDFAIDTRSHFR